MIMVAIVAEGATAVIEIAFCARPQKPARSFLDWIVQGAEKPLSRVSTRKSKREVRE